MATINAVILKRRVDKKGESIIQLAVSQHGLVAYISTPLKVKIDSWDFKKHRVMGFDFHAKSYNRQIDEYIKRGRNILESIEDIRSFDEKELKAFLKFSIFNTLLGEKSSRPEYSPEPTELDLLDLDFSNIEESTLPYLFRFGFIMIPQQIRNWDLFSDSNSLKVFIYCLSRANIKDKPSPSSNVFYHKGEFIGKVDSMAQDCGMTYESMKGALQKLVSAGCIKLKGLSKGTLIQINDFDMFHGNLSITPNKPKTQTQTDPKQDPKHNKGILENLNIKKGDRDKRVVSLSQFLEDLDNNISLSDDDKNCIKWLYKEYPYIYDMFKDKYSFHYATMSNLKKLPEHANIYNRIFTSKNFDSMFDYIRDKLSYINNHGVRPGTVSIEQTLAEYIKRDYDEFIKHDNEY